MNKAKFELKQSVLKRKENSAEKINAMRKENAVEQINTMYLKDQSKHEELSQALTEESGE